ncbi:MAG: hypothetical protein B6I24_10170 [Bacteroidetes bacterium 4572_128]|nr:MAG: hypothetical protein B6I24_10170 [Bacteroidetes bacterium 4572_128]
MKKNFFFNLNFQKTINFFKIFISYYFSKLIKKPFIFGEAFSLSIEPCNFCNLQCLECPTGKKELTRKIGEINFNFYKKIIDENMKNLIFLFLYFQGEPYLSKNFFKLISYANKQNIYTKTSTNGHFLDEKNIRKTILSGLDELIISVDGTNQKSYESYRKGGNFNKLLDSIKNFTSLKKKLKSKKPYIIIQFLVLRSNENEISDMKNLFKILNADKLEFKTAQFYNFKNGNPLIPINNKFSRYKIGKNGKYFIKNKLKNHCWRSWSSAVITWDFWVLPCCFDKNAEHKMGNLKEKSLKKIWNGKLYKNFRKKIFISRKNIYICKNCNEGLKI